MGTLAQRMTVDEFLAWTEDQEGRWELHDGVPHRMGWDTVGHGDVRMATTAALMGACREADQPCCTLPRGLGVRVSSYTMYIPDCLVYAGPKLPGDAIEVRNPVILVEVTSPAMREMDASVKRDAYFSLPSVHHYLIVDPKRPPIVHHSRRADGRIVRSAVREGTLTLAPPGIEVGVAEMFAIEL